MMAQALTQPWKLGPYAVVGEGWLPEWLEYAERTFMPHPAPDTPCVRVRLLEVLPGQELSIEVAVNRLDIERQGSCFHIETQSVNAVFDPSALTLDLRVKFHASDAHMTLGNALRGMTSVALPLFFDGLMIHASSAVVDGNGMIFSGVSTAGKTTMALGLEEGKFLSDDISLVKNLSTRPQVLESPFFGAAGRRGFDLDADLAVACLLAKSFEGTKVETRTRREAASELLRHVVCFTKDPAVQAAILDRVTSLVQRVPVVSLARDLDDPSDVVARTVLRHIRRGEAS